MLVACPVFVRVRLCVLYLIGKGSLHGCICGLMFWQRKRAHTPTPPCVDASVCTHVSPLPPPPPNTPFHTPHTSHRYPHSLLRCTTRLVRCQGCPYALPS